MVPPPTVPLFADCVFAFVISRTLSESLARESKLIVEENGGKVLPFDDEFDLLRTTHIIADSMNFPQYAEARLQLKPVVTVSWITASLNKSREAPIRPYTPDPNMIFANVTITCEGLPSGDKDAIIGAVLAMGGMESSALTKVTTHICALNMDGPKCQSVVDKGLKCKVVLPHWFDDCMKLGKRIDERPYTLPNAEIFTSNPNDPLPMPTTDILNGASSPRPGALPMPTDSPTRKLTVFARKTVMISTDLNISGRLRKVLEDLIVAGGGTISNSVHNSDMYVCHWREGRDYVFASRMGLNVGNLSWIYHLIATNEWISPLRKLLHYPLPKDGIPGFKDFRITLSNYGGEARTYLENLVVAAGAEFTKSMKQDNTHLITARKSSEKCEAAMEWNIEMINHLWIEESYAKCQVQKLTDPRYTHFPPRTNLGEIIGQTQFDPVLLQRTYFPRDPTPSPEDPRPLKRKAMHEKDRNAPSSRRTDSEGDVDMEDEDEEGEPKTDYKKLVPRQKSKKKISHLSTPASRRVSAGNENDTPSTGSRSAKDKANSRIHAAAPDIALYEKEKKRKGPVWGGERAASRIDKERSTDRSSSPAQKNDEAMEEYSEDESRHPKRQKSGLPPVQMRLLITGYKGWLNNLPKEYADKKKLRDIGVLVTTDPRNCTHVAAPSMVRTQKFLCALACGPTILTSEFIDDCVSSKSKIPAVEKYILKDEHNEKKFGLKLKDAISRAKQNKRNLLRRVPVYCTADVQNGPATYKEIVSANGGALAVYTGRPFVKKTSAEEDDGPAEPVYLLSGSKASEKKLWPIFAEMAKEGNMVPRIVEPEWLLDVSLTQQNKWSDKYLVESKK